MNIAISDLSIAEWDARTEPEVKEELESLADSIKQHGFINPLTAVKVGNKYRIIAGRRRLAAAKMIGLKKVPVYVNPHVLNEKTITLLENTARKDLSETEKGNGFIEIYESEGFKPQDTIKYLKAIHNFYQRYKSENVQEWSWNEFNRMRQSLSHSRQAGGKQTNDIMDNEKFMALVKQVGQSPNYQYQAMQVVTQLEPEVLKLADKKGLNMEKKIMLTTRPLRDHPKIQKVVIDELASKDMQKEGRARQYVQQTALDLETGQIFKTTDNKGKETYGATWSKDQKVGKDDKVVRPLEIRPTDIFVALNKIFYAMTDHKLNKGEHDYTKEMIDNTKGFRLEVIKSCQDRTLILLEKELKLNKQVTDEILQVIDKEFEARKMKKEIGGR